jgi:hypothetical protein
VISPVHELSRAPRRAFGLRAGHSQSTEPFCFGKPSDSYREDRVGALNRKKNSKTGKRRERKLRKKQQHEVTGTQVNRSVCPICSKAFYHHLEFLEHAVSCSGRYLALAERYVSFGHPLVEAPPQIKRFLDLHLHTRTLLSTPPLTDG